MTDENIIKALHCCTSLNEYGGECDEGCPYLESEGEKLCYAQMTEDALSLIMSQKTELDILKIELQAMRNAANSYKAEVERLQKENNQFADIGKMYSEIKAEAIKEFAERLKNKLTSCSKAIDGKSEYLICDFDIDNLVKEMVGE